MPVSAPPQHPGSTVTTEQDRYEALIEEARQRARRRRQTYGAVAVAIAAVVAATVVISGRDAGRSEPSALDRPFAAAASGPTVELVASMLTREVVGHRNLWLYLYADGRLISAAGPDGGWLERRLTAEAVAQVQDEIISSGLFDPDRPPPGSQGASGPNLQALRDDRPVNVIRAEGQTWTPEFDRLAGRLASLESWLPATAWAQREATSYIPTRYAVCAPSTLARADLLSQLPVAAAAVLETASVPPWDQILSRIDPAGRQRHGDDGVCFDVERERAQRLAESLDHHLDLASSRRGLFLRVGAPGSETIGLLFVSILPHGAPECACYG